MLFLSGVTACPACDRPLDATDDAIALQLQGRPGARPLPEPGFYHRDCLLALPQHGECVAAFRAQIEALLAAEKETWRLMRFDRRFALAYVPDLDAVRLSIFAECRELSIRCDGPWRELVDVVLSFEAERARRLHAGRPFSSKNGTFTLEVAGEPTFLHLRGGAEKLVRFGPADLARIEAARPDALQQGSRIDFAGLARALSLDPKHLGAPDKAQGVVVSVARGKKLTTVRYLAEKWTSIGFTPADFAAFRAMLAVHV